MKRPVILILLILGISLGFVIGNVKVVSLFKGSHVVYNISGNGVDVDCASCHKHVAEEMAITRALHGPHWDLSCVTCHRYNGTGIEFAVANATGAHPGKQAHAAYVPSCLDCHGGKGAWVYNVSGVLVHAPPARAFNLTTTENYRNWTVISSIPYYAAHKQFVAYCENVLHDENLACLACHTNYSINITYTYHYNVSYWTYNTTSTWIIWNFKPNWSRVYTVHFVKKPIFSGKHIFLPLRKINCSKCHLNIYLGLINGTHAPIYWYYSLFKTNWTAYNLWGNIRYHALGYYDSTTGKFVLYNVSWINDTYCYQCHDLYLFAKYNPSASAVYGLNNAIPVTNSTKVHCAEKVSCLTCHGYGKPYDPYYPILFNQTQSSSALGHRNLLNQTAYYPRMYHGDICMGCHNASVHAIFSCSWCHFKGEVIVNIYSEPSGRDVVW